MRTIALFAYPDCVGLDLIGPMEAFYIAAQMAVRNGLSEQPAYTIELLGPRPGPVRLVSGLEVIVQGTLSEHRGPLDTLMVVGGRGVEPLMKDPATLKALRTCATRARRLASVCTGAFLLAEAGLLRGKRATTHWGSADMLKQYEQVDVCPDRLFVRDGQVWTSAGITAGVDMALAMIEEDLGAGLALDVARYLVMFLKRPGGQTQFSRALSLQIAERGPIAEVIEWVSDHLDEDLSGARLAKRSGMSERAFARAFRDQTNASPARYVQQLRLERARQMLERSSESVKQIAHRCGFDNPSTLRRVFRSDLGVSPREYRARFQTSGSPN